MKGIQRRLGVALVGILALCTGCTGSDAPSATLEAEATATPEPAVTTEAAEPTVAPTAAATATPEPSDDDLIAAAIGALESEGVGELIAWDVMDSMVREDGLVVLTLCGWTGETVFDNVYSSLWDGTGDGGATEVGTSITNGDCLNTQLVDTAFAFTQAYDEFLISINSDPASFAQDARRNELLTPELYPAIESAMELRAQDGITGISPGPDGLLPDSAQAPVLLRQTTVNGGAMELVACRAVNQSAGLYRDGLLVSSSRDDSIDGPHAIDWYQLVRRNGVWQLLDRDGVGFADCYLNDDWPGDVAAWRPGEQWMAIP